MKRETYGLFPWNVFPAMVIFMIDPCVETRTADVRVARMMEIFIFEIKGILVLLNYVQRM